MTRPKYQWVDHWHEAEPALHGRERYRNSDGTFRRRKVYSDPLLRAFAADYYEWSRTQFASDALFPPQTGPNAGGGA